MTRTAVPLPHLLLVMALFSAPVAALCEVGVSDLKSCLEGAIVTTTMPINTVAYQRGYSPVYAHNLIFGPETLDLSPVQSEKVVSYPITLERGYDDYHYIPAGTKVKIWSVDRDGSFREGKVLELHISAIGHERDTWDLGEWSTLLQFVLVANWEHDMTKESVFQLIGTVLAVNLNMPPIVSVHERHPKTGKPSYEETAAWIASKFPLLGEGLNYGLPNQPVQDEYEFVSMEGCVLRFRRNWFDAEDGRLRLWGRLRPNMGWHEMTVPLYDGARAIQTDVFDPGLININTDHASIGDSGEAKSSVLIESKGNFDTVAVVKRMVSAINHAAELCQPPPAKNTEPF